MDYKTITKLNHHMHQLLVESIKEVYFWQYSYTGCFNNMLFDLISKSDPENRHKLRKGFVLEVLAFEMWQNSSDPDEFFKRWFSNDF